MRKLVVGMICAVMLSTAATVPAVGTVSLPKGYESWEKSRQKIVEDKKSLFHGVHYIYLDKKGMKAYKGGGIILRGAALWWSSTT